MAPELSFVFVCLFPVNTAVLVASVYLIALCPCAVCTQTVDQTRCDCRGFLSLPPEGEAVTLYNSEVKLISRYVVMKRHPREMPRQMHLPPCAPISQLLPLLRGQ